MSKALLTFYARVFLGDAEEVTVEALYERKLGPEQSVRAVDLARQMGAEIAPGDVREALQALRLHGLVRQVALSKRVRDEPGWRLKEDWPTVLRELLGRIREIHDKVGEDLWSCDCLEGRKRWTFGDCLTFCNRGVRGSAFVCPFCRKALVLRSGERLGVAERREDNEVMGVMWRLLREGGL